MFIATRQLAVGAAELVAQCCGQAGGGQFLALATGLAGAAAVDLDLLARFRIQFDADELHVHAHVQHQLAPALVLAFLRAQAVDQLAQHALRAAAGGTRRLPAGGGRSARWSAACRG
ncbi:hypothetical protein G6F66_014575 [Rhizopus arrhizus]|nr:hypothetical protein G6F66_014575 [Rhizopus arrhizus]